MAVEDTVEMDNAIPSFVLTSLIPRDKINVVDISHFPTPPTANPPNLLADHGLFVTNRTGIIRDARSARVLLQIPMPTYDDVLELEAQAQEAKTCGCIAFVCPTPQGQMTLDLWVIAYWKAAYDLLGAKTAWESAINWLKKNGATDTLPMLRLIPWKASLRTHMIPSTETLLTYCSTQWLSDTHLGQVTTVLNTKLANAGVKRLMLNPDHFDKLISVYRHSRDNL